MGRSPLSDIVGYLQVEEEKNAQCVLSAELVGEATKETFCDTVSEPWDKTL